MTTLIAVLREQHDLYVDNCKAVGGNAKGFRQWIGVWGAKKENQNTISDSLKEMLNIVTDRVWRSVRTTADNSDNNDPDQEILSIGTLCVPGFLSFNMNSKAGKQLDIITGEPDFGQNDISSPSESWGRVSSKYATVWHLFSHWEIRQKKANESTIAAAQLHEIFTVFLNKATGDFDVRLIDLADSEAEISAL